MRKTLTVGFAAAAVAAAALLAPATAMAAAPSEAVTTTPTAKAKPKYLPTKAQISAVAGSDTPIEQLMAPQGDAYSAAVVYLGVADGQQFGLGVGHENLGSKSFSKGCTDFAAKQGITVLSSSKASCDLKGTPKAGTSIYVHMKNVGEGLTAVGFTTWEDSDAGMESLMKRKAVNLAELQEKRLNKFGFGK